MSIEDRAEAIAKNIEGKIQEAASELTGDPKDRIEGQAKQDEAAAIHAREDLKDKAKEVIDRAQVFGIEASSETKRQELKNADRFQSILSFAENLAQ